MKSENSIERRARIRSNRLLAVWCVWHPDGRKVGLRPPTFYRRRDAVDARNRWNRNYPGHVVIKMTANSVIDMTSEGIKPTSPNARLDRPEGAKVTP